MSTTGRSASEYIEQPEVTPSPEECALDGLILVRRRLVDQPVAPRRDEHRAFPVMVAV